MAKFAAASLAYEGEGVVRGADGERANPHLRSEMWAHGIWFGLEGVAVAAELDGGGEEDGCQGEAGPEAGDG